MGGRPVQVHLSTERHYSCSACSAHLAEYDAVLSKTFQGRFGRAYLVSNVVNVRTGTPMPRLLITGLHTVADAMCSVCNVVVGWRYVSTTDDSQKYKEGKYVLEKMRIVKQNGWACEV